MKALADVELVLVWARGATDGQKCALPTGESLLVQSVVLVFADEFRRHVGAPCPLPRELPLHMIVDWDDAAGASGSVSATADDRARVAP